MAETVESKRENETPGPNCIKLVVVGRVLLSIATMGPFKCQLYQHFYVYLNFKIYFL